MTFNRLASVAVINKPARPMPFPQDQKKIVQEKTTQQAVAEQMETIGVQGEGGDKSVILPVTKNAT